MTIYHLIELLSATLGSIGFAFMFNIKGKRIIPAALSGLVSWGIYLICHLKMELPDFPSYIVAAAGLTLFSELMARVEKAPATIFLVVGMIPLLPGGSLYNTLHYAVASNWSAFTTSGIYTLSVSIAIALGIITMMSFFKVLFVIEKLILNYLDKLMINLE